MRIRLAGAGDAARVAQLNRHVHDLHLAAEPEVYAAPAPGELEGWFRGQLADETVRVFLGETDDAEAIGYLLARLIDRPRHVFVHPMRLVFVEQLAVDTEHQRRGVGRALMAAVEALAREERRELHIGVRAFNAVALRFYERLGYRPIDLRLARAPG